MSFELDHPPHRELAGGDLLAQSLRAQGIDTIFGIHVSFATRDLELSTCYC